ncbi:MAG: hypothetical protein D3910_17285 [Candidatus Electrothrix sp. ATG2]|nr:hypothetical protein [Candidatus Electrothrix sp. ATG2]
MNFTKIDFIVFASAILGVLVSVVTAFIALRTRTKKVSVKINEELKPEKHSGLIILLGPSSGSAPSAIDFHLPNLTYCWMIGTHESLPTIQQLIKKFPAIKFYWGDDYMVNPDEVGSSYDIISRIFNKELPATTLDPTDIIADITGGLKPMSAGMTLACTELQHKMQFMKAPRDQDGSVIRGGIPEPVKVDVILNHSLLPKK